MPNLSFNNHVQSVSRACHYHIRALRHIRSFLTHDSAVILRYCQFETRLLQLTFVRFIGREHSKTATSSEHFGKSCDWVKIKNRFHSPVVGTALASSWLPYSLQNLDPHLQDSPAAAIIPTTSTLQVHSITFFAIRRADATDHSKNQHQNRNQSLQCGSPNHLEQSSSKCQGRCHTRNISVTFEDILFLVGIQHLVTWLRAHDLALAHLRRAINLCTYLLNYK